MKDYNEEYHSRLHKNLLNNRPYYLFRAAYSKDAYLRHLKGRVFEFGCGIGQNIYSIRENSIGIDISDFALKECAKRGINAVKSISRLKGKYDGCLSVHVFEHMENHGNHLKEISRKLKNHGRLVIVLPVAKKNLPEKRAYGKDISKHLYYWNFPAINALLAKNGFKILLNRFNYAKGFSLFYKFPFRTAIFLTRLFGHVTDTKEMIVVAEIEK